MPATILDVARTAKVSAGTVSRVLNGHPSVTRKKHDRVLSAIEKLNYQRRQQKASMMDVNPLQQKNIMLLLLGMDQSLARVPVVASAIHGVEAALADAQANLLISNIPLLDRLPDALARNRIDGVILKGALQGDLAGSADGLLLERLRQLPAVWFLGRPEGFGGDVVQVNDMLVGKLAAEHLVGHGHRRLAFLSAKPRQVTLMRRQASFTFYAQQAGATVEIYLGTETKWQIPSRAVDRPEMVQGLIDRLLDQQERPTAVFAPDDSLGAMIYRALARRDLQVGKHLSLISCNNDATLLLGLYPTPTTIDVHAEEIGRRTVEQLSWRMKHCDSTENDIGMEPTILEGESVAEL